MKLKYLYIIFFLPILGLNPGFNVHGQSIEHSTFEIPRDDPNYGIFSFVEAKYRHGRHLPNNGSLEDILKNPYNAFDLKVGIQTEGNKYWQQVYSYPSWGFGFYSADLGSSDTLGEPTAIYMFFEAPIKRWKRFGFFWEVQIGIAYDFNNYDPVTNPANDVIGSAVNVHLSAGATARYQISNRLDVDLGVDFTHNSNGSTSPPNMGLNMYGLNLGLKYNFNPVRNYTKKVDPAYRPPLRPKFVVRERPPTPKENNINLQLAAGWKTTNTKNEDGTYGSPVYFISTVAVDYMHRYAQAGRFGGGVDFFVDGSLIENLENHDDQKFKDIFQIGYHFGHELIINKFTFITHLGFYAYNNGNKGNFWLRFNLRYDINERFGIQGGLKTMDGGVADFIEWGISYKLYHHAYTKK